MFNRKKDKQVEKITEEFFRRTGFEIEATIEEEDSEINVFLKMEEPQVLIGENGKTLACLQTLLGKILRRKLEKSVYLNLDINDYKKRKLDYLKDLARNHADEVALSKEEKKLVPMPAYERRIIHMELKERSDVLTESEGREPERRVVIRPA
jgi:spoIIIJ-associated protein